MSQVNLTRSALALIGFYALCVAVQFAGASITVQSVSGWYLTLDKSPLTPPGFVFGVVWTVLYFLMALAAWRVWRVEQALRTPLLRSSAQRIWLFQLMAGLGWNAVFFGMQQAQLGLVVIAAVAIAVALCFTRFRARDALAGWLLLPLLLWVCFATYLNLHIALYN